MSTLATRVGLGALGVLVGVYGAILLLQQGGANLLATVYWLAGGVIVHDGVLGFALIAVGALVLLVPGRLRAPVAVGLVVLGTVTMTAIPVLGRFGERADNATLLARNYTVGWLVFALLVAIGTGVGVLRAVRSGPGDGRHDPLPQGGAYGDTVREPHDEDDA